MSKKVEDLNSAGISALATAIIIQAAKDYKTAFRVLMRSPNDIYAQARIAEVEEFFFSDWYEMLTDVDPNYLIRRLKQSVI